MELSPFNFPQFFQQAPYILDQKSQFTIWSYLFYYHNLSDQNSEFNIYVSGCLVKRFFMHLGRHLCNNQRPLREYSRNIQDWWVTPEEAVNIGTCQTWQLGTVGRVVLSISVIREELVCLLMFTLIQASQLNSAMCSAPNTLMFPT